MLRLLLLRGFGLLTGGIGLTLGVGDPGLAVERLRLRIDQAGQCLSLGHRIGRDITGRTITITAGSRGRAAFELIGESQYNLAQGRGFARMLGGGGKRAHRGIDLGLSVGEFIATVGFGDGLALVSGGARGRAAGQGAQIGRVNVRVFHRIRNHCGGELALAIGVLLGALSGFLRSLGDQIIHQSGGALLLDAANHLVQRIDRTGMLMCGTDVVHRVGQVEYGLSQRRVPGQFAGRAHQRRQLGGGANRSRQVRGI